MNEKGIKALKEEIQIGDEISINTRHYSFNGRVTSISDDCFKLDENGLVSSIYFAHVWYYGKD